MYLICEKDSSECPVLQHSPGVFQEALRCGAPRIHVLQPEREDYDLCYVKNADCRPDFIRNRWKNEECYPDYLWYDPQEKSSLYLDFFRIFHRVYIESVNEYTVALTQVLLSLPHLEVFSLDERIQWFFRDRIPVIGKNAVKPGKDVLTIGGPEADAVFDVSFHRVGPVNAFHNVFFLQGQGVTSPDCFPFAELAIDEGAGIGSVLNNLYRFKKALESIGMKPVVRGDKVGHFPIAFLERYFNLELHNPNATEDNTVFFPEMSTLAATMFLDWVQPKQDLNMLRQEFLEEMDEYADAVLGNKRMLGLLIRGTDYLIVHKDGPRKMAGVEDMLPLIHKWLEDYRYDGIFLATEDSDILARIRQEFGDRLIVIAQERHSVSDFAGKQLLAELEKETASDYESSVIEGTVNYFYALYMLSRCAAFICSGPCNGYDLAVGFNGGKYERTHLFRNTEK